MLEFFELLLLDLLERFREVAHLGLLFLSFDRVRLVSAFSTAG
jgi:hypothetical protein